MLSNDVAALLGFGCEAALWGSYTVLFMASSVLWLRRFKAPRRKLNVSIFLANCLLYASCTTHFALEFNHFYLILNATGVDHFADETMPLLGADILISFCDLLGDLILLYRCWVIWDKNHWVVAFPLVTATAGFGCIMGVAHLVLTIDPTSPVPPAALVPLGLAGYALPLATNCMATALIAGRLYASAHSAEKRVGALMSGTMRAAQRAVEIIVESGALYLAVQLVFVVLFAMGHPAQAILAVVAVQIYGIAPTLIVIRVALGMSSDHTTPFINHSATQIAIESEGTGAQGRATFLPAILPMRMTDTDTTDDTGRTMGTQRSSDFMELKRFDSDLGGLAIAV
ncbi:hypothetical protein GSI_14644 [Ganoderma sinense ZZ0214-1]|uniref:Uncharacterized protein n=1 Tax=Ganoderma sinense ZZ0214-1 TaxID=1077348 RepID=A0A2G8RPB3_9APHY|nr:hypothetical protein GSI_14644 [Ganoderma sinense ZZ0214-1]